MKGWAGKALAGLVLAAFVFGVFVVITLPYEMLRKASAESWPSRRGVVQVSYANERRTSSGRSYWRAEVCGHYRDTGERYCARRVRFGGFYWGTGESAAREEAARYAAGREVYVFYDPADPGETLLEARSPWTEMQVLLALGLAGLLLPVVLWLIGRLRKR